MEYWWNDNNGKAKALVLVEKPVPLSLFHHRSHMGWPGIEPGPPQCEGSH